MTSKTWSASDTGPHAVPECFEADRLMALSLEGHLHPRNVRRLRRHLGRCPGCARRFEELEAERDGGS